MRAHRVLPCAHRQLVDTEVPSWTCKVCGLKVTRGQLFDNSDDPSGRGQGQGRTITKRKQGEWDRLMEERRRGHRDACED